MTTITTIIDPPLPTDTPAVFNTKAFEAWGDINTWATEANTVAGEVNTNASTASTAATTATTQAGIATSASATAVSSKNEAVAARNEAVTLTERYQGALASDPALDKTGNPLTDGDWYVNTVTGFIRAYTVAGEWVNGVSAVAGVDSINGLTGPVNSPTQAEAEAGIEATKPMTALSTAQAIASQRAYASQTDAETGADNSKVMTALRTKQAISSAIAGSLLRVMYFTSSGTWTKGAGTKYARAKVCGGGGGGGGAQAINGAWGGGGGGGGYAESFINVTPVSAVTVTVGAAGAAGGGSGTSGGTTSFGAYAVATGGGGGYAGTNDGRTPAPGGVGTTGDIKTPGSCGGACAYRAQIDFPASGEGGHSFLAAGGVPVRGANGVAPQTGGYGAGGSGGYSTGTGQSGGAGHAGICIVEEYA